MSGLIWSGRKGSCGGLGSTAGFKFDGSALQRAPSESRCLHGCTFDAGNAAHAGLQAAIDGLQLRHRVTGDTLNADPPDIWIPIQQEPAMNGRGSFLQGA